MDSEIFASERNHHQRFRLIYRILLGVLLLGAAVLLVWVAFSVNTRSGWVVSVGLVAITGVVVAMAWRMDRERSDMLVTTGPWSQGRVYSGSQSNEIWNSMGKVIVRHQMGFRRLTKTTAMADRPGSFLYRKGVNLIDLRDSEDQPGWVVVSVFATPDLPTTMTDFGRGSGINNELLSAVPGHRRPGDPDLG